MPLPYGTLIGDKMSGCAPLCGNYNFSSNTNTASIFVRWVIDQKTTREPQFAYCFDTPGPHSVVGFYRSTLTGCTNTDTFVINVFPNPISAWSYYPENPEALVEEVEFTNLTKGTLSKTIWKFSGDPPYTSKIKNPKYTFNQPGTHSVTLISVNEQGCSDTLVKNIQVLEDYHVYVPDVFKIGRAHV